MLVEPLKIYNFIFLSYKRVGKSQDPQVILKLILNFPARNKRCRRVYAPSAC